MFHPEQAGEEQGLWGSRHYSRQFIRLQRTLCILSYL